MPNNSHISRFTCHLPNGILWLTTLLVVLSATLVSYGQADAVAYYEKAKKITTGKYELLPGQVAIPMNFGKALTYDQKVLDSIITDDIQRVDLVYSDYPRGMSFQQLNQSRIEHLKTVLPDIFGKRDIHWQIVRQLDCQNRAEAERLFHGFVFSVNKYEPVLKTDYHLNLSRVKEAYLSLPAEDRKFLSMGEDTIAYDVLDRNIRNWEQVTIVSDWTASMYPFTTQILRWHISRHEDSNITNFVFFNDGDGKKQVDKKIGQTGGVYHIEADSFRQVINLMKYVMKQGTGDDLPENDTEALLYAIDSFPQSNAFVLIADNKSTVRDISLLEKIDRPVHVILGRLFMDNVAYIKSHYFNIAYRTGGSLHTRYRDYYNREQLEELRREIIQARRALRETSYYKRQRDN